MDKAEQAYEAAKAEIARVKAAGGDTLDLEKSKYRALARIPPAIAGLTELRFLLLRYTQISDLEPLAGLAQLQRLYLSTTKVTDLSAIASLTDLQILYLANTSVTDLSPMSGLGALRALFLDNTETTNLEPFAGLEGLQILTLDFTQVTDLTPLKDLIALKTLSLRGSKATDLRPIARLQNLIDENSTGLVFDNTAATGLDPRLAELAKIKDNAFRTVRTLEYLRSLPPWPEPYTPAATPDGSPPKPIGGVPERQKIKTAQTQIQHLIRNATVTRIGAQSFATQIEDALRGVPANLDNKLPEPLQTMQEFADVLRDLAPETTPLSDPLETAHLELRIAQLETLVDRLTRQLADETNAREAAEALAKKEGFWSKYKQGAGLAAGAATISVATVGVPTAAVFILGVEHPLVQAFLTVLGRLPKS